MSLLKSADTIVTGGLKREEEAVVDGEGEVWRDSVITVKGIAGPITLYQCPCFLCGRPCCK